MPIDRNNGIPTVPPPHDMPPKGRSGRRHRRSPGAAVHQARADDADDGRGLHPDRSAVPSPPLDCV